MRGKQRLRADVLPIAPLLAVLDRHGLVRPARSVSRRGIAWHPRPRRSPRCRCPIGLPSIARAARSWMLVQSSRHWSARASRCACLPRSTGSTRNGSTLGVAESGRDGETLGPIVEACATPCLVGFYWSDESGVRR
jgi:hypothetical protein